MTASRFNPICFTVLSIALFVLACDQKPADVPPVSEELRWSEIDAFPRVTAITDVWGSGPDDVWVGYYSRGDASLRHFDGQSWQWMPRFVESVEAIWGSGAGDVYVATEQGVQHFDGIDWSDTGVSGHQIVGTSSQDVYVIDRTAVHHFNGAVWDTLRAFSDPYGYANAAVAFPGNALVVARSYYYEPDSLLRWDGMAWTSESQPIQIGGLWGSNLDDFMATGIDASNSGAIWRWDGVQWDAMPISQTVRSVGEIMGVAFGQIYATTCCEGVFLRYDGVSWQAESLPDADGLSNLWASGPNDVYVSAGYDELLHNDGTGWSTAIAGKPQYAEVVWAESPQRVVVVGWREVYRFDHGTWTEEDLGDWGGSPTAIVGRGWNDLYISDRSDGILHYDGAEWAPISNQAAYDVCVTSDGYLFAISYDYVSRWDGVTWTHINTVSDYFFRIWAAGSDYAVVLGSNGSWEYDGSTMTKLWDDDYDDVWGVSDREIYFAGRGGILRYDGTHRDRFGPSEGGFAGIIGTGPDHIIAVGYPYLFVKSGDTWKSSPRYDTEEYLDLVAAIDGSIVRLIGHPETERLSLSYHRP